jgi:hypothetical protein
MVAENLNVFTVNGYYDLYRMYENDELGIYDQRLPDDIPKWYVGEDGTDEELIIKLLDMDTDNLYHVCTIVKGIELVFQITYLGFVIQKTFDDAKITYELMFGEDGIWQNYYTLEEPNHAKDGSTLGELDIYSTRTN